LRALDKFGHEIYPPAYDKMLAYSRVLKAHGYIESLRKPNLFYKHNGEVNFYNSVDGKREYTVVTFFADMRGTKEVPIWQDQSPLFYVKFSGTPPRWLKNRLAGEEFDELKICRESYEQDFENYTTHIEDNRGYCIVCGRDSQTDDSYCSKQCEEANLDLGKIVCQVCGKSLDYKQSREHHLSYAEDKTIDVCQSCHLRIHRGIKLPHLKPVDKPTVIVKRHMLSSKVKKPGAP